MPGAQAFAARFWETVPLPRPHPYIAPGWAITGKLAYLETRGRTTETYSNAETPFGTLEIVATGKYYVDWGDGESSGPHSMEGKAWPEGQITHDYVWARTYDVVVSSGGRRRGGSDRTAGCCGSCGRPGGSTTFRPGRSRRWSGGRREVWQKSPAERGFAAKPLGEAQFVGAWNTWALKHLDTGALKFLQ